MGIAQLRQGDRELLDRAGRPGALPGQGLAGRIEVDPLDLDEANSNRV